MRTVFYKQSENKNGDYWFNNKPYVEWFFLENILYETNVSIIKETVIERDGNISIHNVSIEQIHESFSNHGIIRRIALNII
jgi:hypothetical protein